LKAAILLDKKRIEIRDVPDPKLEEGEVVVKVSSCGICGSDFHAYEGTHPRISYPVILGHELSGTVVYGNDEWVGKAVTVDPNISCDSCYYCKAGKRHFCENLSSIGINRDGAYAELVKVPVKNLYPIPKGLSFDEAALTEPLSCVIHGLDLIAPHAGERALILGAGPVGLMFLQALKGRGANPVIVSEVDDFRLNFSKRFCPDAAVNPLEEDLEKEVRYATDGRGADMVIETTGKIDVLERSFDYLAPTGRLLAFAVYATGSFARVPMDKIYRYELVMRGSFTNPYTMQRAINAMGSGAIDVKSIITHIITLGDVEAALSRKIEHTEDIVIHP
jgi:2-desacetyl-2-hydroxyethyl bacteriochlorophyllide A dehydrogenase